MNTFNSSTLCKLNDDYLNNCSGARVKNAFEFYLIVRDKKYLIKIIKLFMKDMSLLDKQMSN